MRNAWIVCKDCACEVSYFAYCDNDGQLSCNMASRPITPSPPKKCGRSGLYEALLELEDDPELGDLNDRKIESQHRLSRQRRRSYRRSWSCGFRISRLCERDQWQPIPRKATPRLPIEATFTI